MASIDQEEIATYDGNIWALEHTINFLLHKMGFVPAPEVIEDFHRSLERHIEETQPNASEHFRRGATGTLGTIFRT